METLAICTPIKTFEGFLSLLFSQPKEPKKPKKPKKQRHTY